MSTMAKRLVCFFCVLPIRDWRPLKESALVSAPMFLIFHIADSTKYKSALGWCVSCVWLVLPFQTPCPRRPLFYLAKLDNTLETQMMHIASTEQCLSVHQLQVSTILWKQVSKTQPFLCCFRPSARWVSAADHHRVHLSKPSIWSEAAIINIQSSWVLKFYHRSKSLVWKTVT